MKFTARSLLDLALPVLALPLASAFSQINMANQMTTVSMGFPIHPSTTSSKHGLTLHDHHSARALRRLDSTYISPIPVYMYKGRQATTQHPLSRVRGVSSNQETLPRSRWL